MCVVFDSRLAVFVYVLDGLAGLPAVCVTARLQSNASLAQCTGGAAFYIDKLVFGLNHIYQVGHRLAPNQSPIDLFTTSQSMSSIYPYSILSLSPFSFHRSIFSRLSALSPFI